MKFLDLTGLQYFYDKYLRPLKDAAFKNTANNLTTETEGSVLDARQGKVLNDLKLSIAKVINNLLTTEAGFALDARQGKVLDDKITELNGNISNILQKRSKTNRINVTAGQKATSRIIIDPIEGYTPVLATVWSSHVTTTVSDSRIVGSDAMFVFSADAQQTPETFTADVVYVKDIAL